VSVSVLVGGAIIFPSLVLLFRLAVSGRFRAAESAPLARAAQHLQAGTPGLLARAASACLIAGFGLLNVADAGWAHGVGIVCLLAFVVLGFRAIAFNLLGSRPRSGEAENVARDTTMS
jgi:cytochrome d ubiquinol oxidase subunit II